MEHSELCSFSTRHDDQFYPKGHSSKEKGWFNIFSQQQSVGYWRLYWNGDQAKEDTSELLQKKLELEKEKKALEESALRKETALDRKLKKIGNYVHDSVPVSNTEVCATRFLMPTALFTNIDEG